MLFYNYYSRLKIALSVCAYKQNIRTLGQLKN